MSTLASATRLPCVTAISISNERLTISLSDGREISVPMVWYPRLLNATAVERSDWRLIGDGLSIHWPQIEEDISVLNVIEGRPSVENQRSLLRWLASRRMGVPMGDGKSPETAPSD